MQHCSVIELDRPQNIFHMVMVNMATLLILQWILNINPQMFWWNQVKRIYFLLPFMTNNKQEHTFKH